jgi:hypothetical protein
VPLCASVFFTYPQTTSIFIDNQNEFHKGQEYKTVYNFLNHQIGQKAFYVVSPYFSAGRLARAYRGNIFQKPHLIKMILAKLVRPNSLQSQALELIKDQLNDFESALLLSQTAKEAVAFLQSEKVVVKTFGKNFCHAKAYIYKDEDRRNSFYVMGSSNFTEAGLGAKENTNIELRGRRPCEWCKKKTDRC